jgi:hypothetical protein
MKSIILYNTLVEKILKTLKRTPSITVFTILRLLEVPEIQEPFIKTFLFPFVSL